ncbi:hypothetical protein [Paenisporosarcina sp. TG-14]|uniref:hypothetical protein n=1 Tax=Paenisporosarcina sp. TG-14 TaxID=1231057 RepID=UPI0003159C6F|nr:hypothetical protein [Paenisporosarcina sp. TG-14]
MNNNQNIQGTFTKSGTNITDVKSKNEQSGMTYNQVKNVLANTTGNKDEGNYSQTDIANVKKNNQ